MGLQGSELQMPLYFEFDIKVENDERLFTDVHKDKIQCDWGSAIDFHIQLMLMDGYTIWSKSADFCIISTTTFTSHEMSN